MVTVRRTEDFLAHKGKKGMKWGYNDGSRNGRRTAGELKEVAKAVAEYDKNNKDPNAKGTGDVEGDYHEANNMLKYLGITLDLQSDNAKVAETMAIYNQMKNTKDSYKTQHEWLKAFSEKLSGAGYDMTAVDKMLDEKKTELNVMNTGTGTGNREKSNQDWKENDAPKSGKESSSKKSTSKSGAKKSSGGSSSSKSSKSSSKSSGSPSKSSSSKSSNTKSNTSTKSTDSKNNSFSVVSQKKEDPRKANNYKKKVQHSDFNQNGVGLYHHGILGQRWGVRRFQNKDGSLTDEGRKHYSHMTDAELKEAVSRKRLENRYKELKTGSSSNIQRSVEGATGKAGQLAKAKYGDKNVKTKTINAAGSVAKDAAKIADKASEAKVKSDKKKIDTSQMSKEDLQKAINRMELEKEYQKLTKDEIVKGKLITTDTLQSIGLVASTAVDVVTLAVLINKIMKK